MQSRVSKWGNSLAVRIPKDVADRASLRDGDSVRLTVSKGGAITVEPLHRYSLDELVSKINKNNRHGETDWGRVGLNPGETGARSRCGTPDLG
jgi:antitoxin MazE